MPFLRQIARFFALRPLPTVTVVFERAYPDTFAPPTGGEPRQPGVA